MARPTIQLNAPAKVNLCLAVHFPPHDGYHQVDSVFQELDFGDVVRVHVDEREADLVSSMGTRVALECAVPGLRLQDNLVFRAIDEAEQACGVPAAPAELTLAIEIDKRIPAGGGLGGGSSDAAAALKAYARLTGVDVHDERLVNVARRLGADVAFFLYGGCALMSGRGDVLECSLPRLGLPIVLMGDAQSMSTAAVYQAFDDAPPPLPDAGALAEALEAGASPERLAALCANNLGPVACACNERLQERLDIAREHPDVLGALVSGSGSTSFAICPDDEAAARFAQDAEPLCDWVRICS